MKLRVTVNGVAYDVDVEILEEKAGTAAPGAMAPAPAPSPRPIAPVAPAAPAAPAPAAAGGGGKSLNCTIPGTVLEILVKPGQEVKAGETVIIVDAMKMNTPIAANQDGVVKDVPVSVGEAVKVGQALVNFE